MNRRTFGILATLATVGLVAAGCSREPKPPTIGEVITSNQSFSTLSAALQTADLTGTLDSGGPYTVFAPRNSAFDALPDGILADLLLPENKAELRRILGAHVVPGTLLAADLVNKTTEVTTIDGTNFIVDGFNGVKVTGSSGGDVTVVQPDVLARNGVIHVIDGILLP